MTCFFYSSEIDKNLYDIISSVSGFNYDLRDPRVNSTHFTWTSTIEGLLSDPVLKPLVLRLALIMILDINPFDRSNQVQGLTNGSYFYSPATITIRPETLAAFLKKNLTEVEIKKFLSLNDLVSCLLLTKLEPQLKAVALGVMYKIDITKYAGNNLIFRSISPEDTHYFVNTTWTTFAKKPLPLNSIQPNAKAENIRLAYLAVKSMHSLKNSGYYPDAVCPILTLKACPKDLHKDVAEAVVNSYLSGQINQERNELEAIKISAPRTYKESVTPFLTPGELGLNTRNKIRFPMMSPKEKLDNWEDLPRSCGSNSKFTVIKDRDVQNYLLKLKDTV
jgi:hypothetical protein